MSVSQQRTWHREEHKPKSPDYGGVVTREQTLFKNYIIDICCLAWMSAQQCFCISESSLRKVITSKLMFSLGSSLPKIQTHQGWSCAHLSSPACVGFSAGSREGNVPRSLLGTYRILKVADVVKYQRWSCVGWQCVPILCPSTFSFVLCTSFQNKPLPTGQQDRGSTARPAEQPHRGPRC